MILGYLYTVREAAHVLQVRPERICRWIRAGKLKAVRLAGGQRRRIRERDLFEFLNLDPDKENLPVRSDRASTDTLFPDETKPEYIFRYIQKAFRQARGR